MCYVPPTTSCRPSKSSMPVCRTRERSSIPSPITERPQDVDLRWVGVLFYRNGEIEETGLAAGVLGHPAMAIAWLANKLAPFDVTLEPGHMMLSGSFTRPLWAQKGDTLHA